MVTFEEADDPLTGLVKLGIKLEDYMQPIETPLYALWGLVCSEFARWELVIDEVILQFVLRNPKNAHRIGRRFPNQMKEKLEILWKVYDELEVDYTEEDCALFRSLVVPRNDLIHGVISKVVGGEGSPSIGVVRRRRSPSNRGTMEILSGRVDAAVILNLVRDMHLCRSKLLADFPGVMDSVQAAADAQR